jgi:hypothetical protein
MSGKYTCPWVACWQTAFAAADQIADPPTRLQVRERLSRAYAQAGRDAEALDLLGRP